MNDLITINYDTEQPTVSGRELHTALDIGTEYVKWIERMLEYGFTENEDYSSILTNRSDGKAGKPRTDHALTIPMAKELCMLQRNEKGKQFRQYFIKVEEAWNSPEMIMKRALDIANSNVRKLQAQVSTLAVDNEIMRPKAEYFDELVDRNNLTCFRETAKELHIGERVFINYLLEHKYIYRDKRGKIMPYANKNDGLFEVKETFNEKTNWKGTQTLITPKGRETFRMLML